MRESNFYQDIYSFLKLYRKKRVLKFLLPVLLGVLYKLNSIALFIFIFFYFYIFLSLYIIMPDKKKTPKNKKRKSKTIRRRYNKKGG